MSTAREELPPLTRSQRQLEDWLIDHRRSDAYDLSNAIITSDWLKDHVAAQVEAALAEQREGIAAAIEELETARTQAWLKGWDSVPQHDAAKIARTYTQEAGE